MPPSESSAPRGPLSPDVVARVYDRIGRFQDRQGFYERRPVDELIREGRLDLASSVVEIGCGTGRLAARLLDSVLPADATYLGLDVSPGMVELATRTVEPFGSRAQVRLTDGALDLPVPDRSVDRVLSVYVVDLLGTSDARRLTDEAHRVLPSGGMLCLASLTEGTGRLPRAVSGTWRTVWERWPRLVGGCRPVELLDAFATSAWRIRRSTVTSFAVTTELIVATPASGDDARGDAADPGGR